MKMERQIFINFTISDDYCFQKQSTKTTDLNPPILPTVLHGNCIIRTILVQAT